MPASPVIRAAQAIVAGVLLGGVLVAAPADARPVAPGASERRVPNPTGVASGSYPNGAEYLKLSLATLKDGRLRVSWVRPGKYVKRYVVKVGVNRQLDVETKSYRVGRKRQALIVPRAAGTYTSSGNYSFVKLTVYRKDGTVGSSPTKWIQAPIGTPCTAATKNRVTVGTFNVRTWTADPIKGAFSWNLRRKHVISEIKRSGAHVVAVQEASGQVDQGFGNITQREWIVKALNVADPAANWVPAMSDDFYKPFTHSLGGTRIFFDANRFTKLNEGLLRIPDAGAPKDSMLPWVRLQATGQAPFVFTSNHLDLGDAPSDVKVRGREISKVISKAKQLRATYGNQVIVAGDMNSTINNRPYNNVQRALLKAGFYDAFATTKLSGAKFPTTNQYKFPLKPTPLRRDYIMTLGSVKGSCSYRNLYYTSKSLIASDHFMQVATLPLPPA
ncbi:endonuclease/exonuclease/phosphatase family protein [Nocardioides sp. URHA0020]|uniref:endonuclease/exonuclease/phosphatase family protein n=1 Tax=Nocardioides sp. URHA0020 TaxID=1380392 RepID=UPI000A78B484|nr:endonuclease/exonuclease/phosphatase family protein [Nocardioides sp. URHA0020]